MGLMSMVADRITCGATKVDTAKLLAYLSEQTETFKGSQTNADYAEGWRDCAAQIAKHVRNGFIDGHF
jgi:hypothetical protein